MFVFGIIFHKVTNPLLYTIAKLAHNTRNIILLLVDKKSPINVYQTIDEYIVNYNNVFWVKSISIDWAKFSLTEAPLLLMQEALKWNFKYFSLISGDDIPILTNTEMDKFLDESYEGQKEFIGYCPKAIQNKNLENPYVRLSIDYPDFFYKRNSTLLSKIIKKCSFYYLSKFKRKDLSHLPTLYKGNNWFTITNIAVEYVLNYIRENSEYLNSFKKSYISDEVFFQTILFNSVLKDNINGIYNNIPDCEMALRYIDWNSGPEYPKILTKQDLPKIKNSNLLFARKIDSAILLSTLHDNFD